MIFATEPSYFYDQTVMENYTLWRLPPMYREPERRLLRRIESAFLVYIPELNKSLTGVNVSLAGLLCECELAGLPEDKFQVELMLPGMSEMICLSGSVIEYVAGNDRPTVRIRFHDLSWRALEVLSRWVLSKLN